MIMIWCYKHNSSRYSRPNLTHKVDKYHCSKSWAEKSDWLVGNYNDSLLVVRMCHRMCVCVCVVCVCLYSDFSKLAAKWVLICIIMAQHDNISKLIVSDLWLKALISSYSVMYSPWCPLRVAQSQAKTSLFTVSCFSPRQLRLYHQLASNTSETWNQGCQRLAAICPYTGQFSSSNWSW